MYFKYKKVIIKDMKTKSKINLENHKKQIKKLVEKYKEILLLQDRTINVKIIDEKNENYATSQNNYPYTDCYLDFFTGETTKLTNKELESLVIHELIHCHLQRFTRVARDRFIQEREVNDVNENLTEIFTKIITNLQK